MANTLPGPTSQTMLRVRLAMASPLDLGSAAPDSGGSGGAGRATHSCPFHHHLPSALYWGAAIVPCWSGCMGVPSADVPVRCSRDPTAVSWARMTSGPIEEGYAILEA